jgi:hypothetical protein
MNVPSLIYVQVYDDNAGDWGAMAAATPPQYCVGPASLAKCAPPTARAFAVGVVEGTYFDAQ